MAFDINQALAQWQKRLLDIRTNSPLINFKNRVALVCPVLDQIWGQLVTDGKGMEFAKKCDLRDQMPSSPLPDSRSGQDPAPVPLPQNDLELCRRSARFRADHLLADLDDEPVANKLTRMYRFARESLAEQGVGTLYVAFGMLHWFESDSSVVLRSPLLLLAVQLKRQNLAAPWRVEPADQEVLTNDTLWERLKEMKIAAPEKRGTEGGKPSIEECRSYFDRVREVVQHHRGWLVTEDVALGNVNFPKLAMREDLTRNVHRIAKNPLCCLLAGDTAASLPPHGDLPEPKDLDEKEPPDKVSHILDADSSQHAAIAAVKRGASIVLEGPPCTGKSQTIANIIAEYLANEKTVLFVSEKAAALDVVYRKLQQANLATFCLACHSHKASRADVIGDLARQIEDQPAVDDRPDSLQRLTETRQRLNDYVRELHRDRPALGLSYYKVLGKIAGLGPDVPGCLCQVHNVLGRDQAYVESAEAALKELGRCREVVNEHERHPWRGCTLTEDTETGLEEVRHHFGRIADFLDAIQGAVATFHRLGFCENSDPGFLMWNSGLRLAGRALSCPLVPRQWFGADGSDVNRAVQSAKNILALESVRDSIRRHLPSLAGFSPDSLRQASSDDLTRAAKIAGDIKPTRGLTLLKYRDSLIERGEALSDWSDRLNTIQDTAGKVGGVSPSFANGLTLPDLAKVAEQLVVLASLNVPASWLQTERRRELLDTLPWYREQQRFAVRGRADLLQRLTIEALDSPQIGAEAAQAAGFRWFVARLLPSWWSFRARAARWYRDGVVPTHGELLADMARLAAYHRATALYRQAEESYRDDLLRTGTSPDWDGTLKGLEAMGVLAELGGDLGPAILHAFLAPGMNGRTLAEDARELVDQISHLRRELGRRWKETADQNVTVLATTLCRKTQETAGHICDVEFLVSWLATDKDIQCVDLSARAKGLNELGTQRKQEANFLSRLGADVVSAEQQLVDRSLAEQFIKWYADGKSACPAHVIRVITVQQDRSSLEEAVRSINEEVTRHSYNESWQFLERTFPPNVSVSTGILITSASSSALRDWLRARTTDTQRLGDWLRFDRAKKKTEAAGLGEFVQEVLKQKFGPEVAANLFLSRFYSRWRDAVRTTVPVLNYFNHEERERLIEEFRVLDRAAIRSAADRIRKIQFARRERLLNASTLGNERAHLIKAAKAPRRPPLRKLFRDTASVLQVLKPCVMMSPLAVSTYLESEELRFDLVIFDEASQVRTHDAIAAICRGTQLVVAGDPEQLPPNSLFDRAPDDEEWGADGEIPPQPLPVLLDEISRHLRTYRLLWHYRSRREGLIDFSNREIYHGELITFPSPDDKNEGGERAVTMEYVASGRWGGRKNPREAERTAELVLDHFRWRRDESLGVIAFNRDQQELIEDVLERKWKDNPELEKYFDPPDEPLEPFFVKNLENVQGDERDAIILAVGYGPAQDTGKVSMNFGPLNQEHGERRLNVAVTRARRRVAVVSSLRANDIDLTKTKARGVRLLRMYLDYAARGLVALSEAVSMAANRGFDSPFEEEVCRALEREGWTAEPQVGCAKYRIDLGVVDPDRPGRFLLGIECDGATYHRSATARDRDRLRQEVLEGLGWTISRVWSTDWWRSRPRQIARLKEAYEAALKKEREKPEVTPDPSPPGGGANGPDASRGDGTSESRSKPVPRSIDQVSDHDIQAALCHRLGDCEAMQDDDLIKVVRQGLGFGNTGSKIKARILAVLDRLIRDGLVCRVGIDRVQIVRAAAAPEKARSMTPPAS